MLNDVFQIFMTPYICFSGKPMIIRRSKIAKLADGQAEVQVRRVSSFIDSEYL